MPADAAPGTWPGIFEKSSLPEKIAIVCFFIVICSAIAFAVIKLCYRPNPRYRSENDDRSSILYVVPVDRNREINAVSSELGQQGAMAASVVGTEPTTPQRARLPERRHETQDQRRRPPIASFFGGNRNRANDGSDLESQELDTLPPYSPPQYSQFSPPEQQQRKMGR